MSRAEFALPRSISVLMPTFQAAAFLDRVLEALARQELDCPWDFHALDCASSDATLEIFARWKERFPVPLTVHALGAIAFDHGDTRNRLAALCQGELLVYLTDDAIPAAADWLATLRANFADPRVAAAYCRNEPRADARPFARVATRDDPTYSHDARAAERPLRERALDLGAEELRSLYNFSDTASAVRRSLWERHPYPITQAGEDVLLARALIDAGYLVRYDPDAVVWHAHEWSPERVRLRATVDARFNAETFGRVPVPDEAHAERRVLEVLERDRAALEQAGLVGVELKRELAHAESQRRAHFFGLLEGQGTPLRRLQSALLESPRLSILLCAGARLGEVALRLQGELSERGHRCAILSEDLTELDATAVEVLHVLEECDPDALVRAHPALAHVPVILPERGGWSLLAFGLAGRGLPSAALIAQARLEASGIPGLSAAEEFEARQWECRYRALASLAQGEIVVDRWARECDAREGAVVAQGSESLLLGRMPAAITFEFGVLPPAAWVIEVHLELLGEEPALSMQGRVLVDGRALEGFGPMTSDGRTRIAVVRVPLALRSRPSSVRIETGLGSDRKGFARVRRVIVRRPNHARRASVHAAIDRLRVYPGPPLEDRALPRVSVVIPTLEGKALLERCLPALLASEYPRERFEIIVADNGSQDGTAEFLARSHPAARLVALGNNLGFTRAVAAGVAAAERADIFVLLNNDVVVEPAWLRELVSPIARGECAATGARMLLPDGRPEFLGGGANLQGFALGFAPGEDSAVAASEPRRALFACGGAMAIEARAWRDVGGLDLEFFAYYDDLDLGWRLWLRGYEVHYVPTAVCRHARSSTSRRFAQDAVRRLQVRNGLLCCIKNYDDEHLDRVLPALLALAARRTWVMSRKDGAPELALEGRRPLPRWRRWWRERRKYELEPLAFADLAALNEVLGAWDHWMARRAEVQAGRRRSDAEIFELFVDPLWCVEGEREYVELQDALARRFDLRAMFGVGSPERARAGVPPARGGFEMLAARAGRLEIAGWLAALEGAIDEVEIRIDGRPAGRTAATERADAPLRSGFTLSASLPEGSPDSWRRIEALGQRAGSPVAVMACLWRADFSELFEDAPVADRLDRLRTLQDLLDALRPHRSPQAISRVLELSAGGGRVGGVLRSVQPTWRVSASDFEPGTALPPLPCAERAFDLILASSVFTHLGRERQAAWITELRRVLADDGILLATVQGPGSLQVPGLDAQLQPLREHGILEGVPAGDHGRVFQSEGWTRRHWGREFEILDYLPCGAQGLQDLVVLRRRRGVR